MKAILLASIAGFTLFTAACGKDKKTSKENVSEMIESAAKGESADAKAEEKAPEMPLCAKEDAAKKAEEAPKADAPPGGKKDKKEKPNGPKEKDEEEKEDDDEEEDAAEKDAQPAAEAAKTENCREA